MNDLRSFIVFKGERHEIHELDPSYDTADGKGWTIPDLIIALDDMATQGFGYVVCQDSTLYIWRDT